MSNTENQVNVALCEPVLQESAKPFVTESYPSKTAGLSKCFGFHKLNDEGQRKSVEIAGIFEDAAMKLAGWIDDPRCWSIVKTKLEEACFYAKKGMALNPNNQMEVQGQ